MKILDTAERRGEVGEGVRGGKFRNMLDTIRLAATAGQEGRDCLQL